MTVKEAEDIINDISFIINEFYIYNRKAREQAEKNDDFTNSLNESIKYLKDYEKLLKDKIKSAILYL